MIFSQTTQEEKQCYNYNVALVCGCVFACVWVCMLLEEIIVFGSFRGYCSPDTPTGGSCGEEVSAAGCMTSVDTESDDDCMASAGVSISTVMTRI